MLNALPRRVRETDVGQSPLGPSQRVSPRYAVQATEECQVLDAGDALVKGAVAGWKEADLPPHRHRLGGDVDARDMHAARIGQQQSGQDAEKGGLSGAVGADQRRNATGADPKVDAGKNFVLPE